VLDEDSLTDFYQTGWEKRTPQKNCDLRPVRLRTVSFVEIVARVERKICPLHKWGEKLGGKNGSACHPKVREVERGKYKPGVATQWDVKRKSRWESGGREESAACGPSRKRSNHHKRKTTQCCESTDAGRPHSMIRAVLAEGI